MLNKCGPQFFAALALLLVVTTAPAALAEDTSDQEELELIIEQVRLGWLAADGTPFRENFLDFEGARYFESGGQNVGLSDLISHHVEPEAGAFEEFQLNFSNIETHIEGDFAWAIVDTEIMIILKSDGRKIHNKGHETFLFRSVDDQWKVIHTHSSSRPVKNQDHH
jgi:ketosteroid isomerase-like protein